MLLGKRPRPAIKRTTSMTEFSLDVGSTTTTTVEGGGGGGGGGGNSQQFVFDPNNPSKGLDQRFMAAASVSPSPRPRNVLRRNSADFAAASETAHFLRACSLCKRRLIPGRDIYMYRGDSAFCSLECRQQQMNQDERKEKCSLVASKKENANVATASSQVSTEGETVAAV